MPLQNGSSSSAGVYSGVIDNSARGSTVAPRAAAIVVPSHRGKVGEGVLVTSKETYRAEYGIPDPSISMAGFCAEHFLTEGNQLWVVRPDTNSLYGGCRISMPETFAEVEQIYQGMEDPETYDFNEDDLILFYAANPGAWNNDIRLVVYPDTNDSEEERFFVEVYEGASSIAKEVHRVTLRERIDGYGSQIGLVPVLESSSRYIRAVINEEHPRFVSDPSTLLVNNVMSLEFSQGDNGDDVSIDNIIEAWDYFEDPEEVAVQILINAGYANPAVQLRMLEIAENRGDAFAILDVPSDKQLAPDAAVYRRETLNTGSRWGALYLPDVLITTSENLQIYCPPSGYIAAAYARNDRDAAVWFAPAGITRGKVLSDGLRHKYDQAMRDYLDQAQVNFIHKMAGHGNIIWSQLNLQNYESTLRQIHAQRLVSHLDTVLKDATLVGVYEPNDRDLRLQLEAIAEGVLGPVKQGRGLYGYEIICDETNNTNDTIANGDTILDVYLDITQTTKRIHLNAIVPKTGQLETTVAEI